MIMTYVGFVDGTLEAVKCIKVSVVCPRKGVLHNSRNGAEIASAQWEEKLQVIPNLIGLGVVFGTLLY